jgi:hypothetical protein
MVKLKDAGIYANKGGTAEEDDSKTGSALTTRR